MKLGNYIRFHIKEAGITQSELAHMTGYSRQMISNVITGQRDLTFEMAIAFEAALGVSALRFLNRWCADKVDEIRRRDG